jgi:AraC-like DNA-binding protein
MPVHPRPTTTGMHQIGIAFSGHRRLVYETAGRTVETDHAPGVTIVSGAEPVTWLRVHEPVEALEMYPDPALVAGIAAARDGTRDVTPRIGRQDGTVLAIGSAFRRTRSSPPGGWTGPRLMVSATTRPVDDIAASVGFTNLSHFRRVFRRHHGLPPSALRPRELR